MKQAKIIPPVYLLVCLFAMGTLHWFLPLTTVIAKPYNYVGMLFVFLGISLAVWAVRLFSLADTPIRPFEETRRLVLSGPYRFTRNPMYLGMVAVLTGVGLLLGSLSPFIVVPLFIFLIQRYFIQHEERILSNRFGDEYRKFAARVRRWI